MRKRGRPGIAGPAGSQSELVQLQLNPLSLSQAERSLLTLHPPSVLPFFYFTLSLPQGKGGTQSFSTGEALSKMAAGSTVETITDMKIPHYLAP